MSDSSSLTPRHERFITFAPAREEGDGSEVPTLIVNPRAITSIELVDDGTSIIISLSSGAEHRIEGLLRPRARALLRDISAGLGDKTAVVFPPEVRVTTRRGA